ncbi:MAG: hypothetical protein CMI63_14390 [Parvularcula sp.]|jgi:hypothetical protein|nr:hypothetical protein [Parvularcula sp.]
MKSIEPLLSVDRCAFLYVAEPYFLAQNAESAKQLKKSVTQLVAATDCPYLDLTAGRDEPIRQSVHTTVRAVSELRRSTMILIGGSLENAVTQIAIALLADGYDVFVAIDLVHAVDKNHTTVLLDRIRSYGGTITTKNQIVLEFLSDVDTDERRSRLQRSLRT